MWINVYNNSDLTGQDVYNNTDSEGQNVDAGTQSMEGDTVNNEEKILEILTQILGDVSDLKQGQTETNKRLDETIERLDTIEVKVDSIDKTVIRIENNQGEKLAVLFDGQKQNSQQLETIKEEVSRHEEVILRKVL